MLQVLSGGGITKFIGSAITFGSIDNYCLLAYLKVAFPRDSSYPRGIPVIGSYVDFSSPLVVKRNVSVTS